MGKGMDMPPAMKRRCQMMMNAKMSKDDAACLLAFKQELKLTPEQVQKMKQIVKESRQEAAAILTPEQQKTLAEVDGQPASMNAMHAKMHEKMMQKMEGAGPKTTEEKAKKEPEGAGSHKKQALPFPAGQLACLPLPESRFQRLPPVASTAAAFTGY